MFRRKRNFYHLKHIPVTLKNYMFVRKVKKQLLSAISNLLDSLHVRYAISDGNLLEYERESPIYHDDDVDIRVDSRDFHIINDYIGGDTKKDNDHNLFFEDFGVKMNFDTVRSWYHVSLITIPRPKFNDKIYLDLVISHEICDGIWVNFDIDFDNLRRINYLDVETFAPSKEDSIRICKKVYGENYLTPNYTLYTPK